MVASYPGTIRVFIPKTDIVDTVYAEHPNSLQDEVVAVQSTLGINPHVSTTPNPAGSFTALSTIFSTLSARLANIETGIVADSHSQYMKRSGGDVIQPGSASTVGLRVRGATNQSADLLQFLSSGGSTIAAFSADGSLSVNNLTVNGTQTNVAGSATALDLGATTGIAAGTGTNFGDKIQLYSSTYGFGVQNNRMVTFLPANAGFAIRQKSNSGYASSGTDAIVLNSDGTSSFTGLQTNTGGLDLAGSGATLAGTGTSLGDKIQLYSNTGVGLTDATHVSLFVPSSSGVVQVAPANTGAGAKSAGITPGVQLTGGGVGNFKSDVRLNNVPMPRGILDFASSSVSRGPSNAEFMIGELSCSFTAVSGHSYRVTITLTTAANTGGVYYSLTLRDGTSLGSTALQSGIFSSPIVSGFGATTESVVWLVRGLSTGAHTLTPSIAAWGSDSNTIRVVASSWPVVMLVEDIGGTTQTAI